MKGNSYQIERAYLVYREVTEHGNYGDGFYFQEHSVIPGKNGSVSLCEGSPLTKEALVTLCKQVVPSIAGELTFLNGKVLASSGMNHGPDVWWIPPAVRAMFFAGDLDIQSGLAPWPGMVAVATDFGINVYAVKGDIRPGLDTELYVAPLFNMGGVGSSVCIGNSKKPEKTNDYSGWEQVLFQSAFTHEGGNDRIKKGKLAIFWEGLIKKGAENFPERQLVSCGLTIGQLMDQLRRGHACY